MIRFKPFKGYIPVKEHIHEVAIRSTDFHSEKDIIDQMNGNELAYLHVTKSNILYPEKTIEDPDYFAAPAAYVKKLLESGTIAEDDAPAFYLYRQTSYSGTFTGIIGLCDVIDYYEDRIKKHENTRVLREKWVARLVDETEMIGEPVLLAHSDHPDIQDAIGQTIAREADIKFAAKNNSVHEIWRLKGLIAQHIQDVYEQISSVYIMDGHHRSASFARLYKETGNEKYRYFQGMMLSSFNIRIWPFHRLVKLSDRSAGQFMEQLKAVFSIEESEHNWPVIPDHKGTFGVYMNGKWFTMRNGDDQNTLDVSVLENSIFKPILNIQDTRSDERLEYLRGNHTIEWLQKITDQSENNVLITLHPCRFEDIQRISDNGDIMPPKSTYIEPKGRSGMIIQKL